MSAKRFIPLVLSAAMVGACGASPRLQPAEITDVESEIRAAEVLGAQGQPKAALHLKLAKDQLAEAQQLASKRQGDKARLTLERARADAELAVALAREAEAEQQARATLEEIERMSQR